MDNKSELGVHMAYLRAKVKEIDEKQDEILKKIESNYITRDDFGSFKESVAKEIASINKRQDKVDSIFSNVSWFIILAVLGAVVSLVVSSKTSL